MKRDWILVWTEKGYRENRFKKEAPSGVKNTSAVKKNPPEGYRVPTSFKLLSSIKEDCHFDEPAGNSAGR